MTRDSCVFYRSFYEAINELDDDQAKLAIYEALFAYALDGVEPEGLKGTPKAILRLIRPVIDKNNQNFMNAQKKKTEEEPKEGQTATDSRPNEERPTSEHRPNAERTGSESNLNKDVDVDKDKEKDADKEKEVLKRGRARGRAKEKKGPGRKLFEDQREYTPDDIKKMVEAKRQAEERAARGREGPPGSIDGGAAARTSEEEGEGRPRHTKGPEPVFADAEDDDAPQQLADPEDSELADIEKAARRCVESGRASISLIQMALRCSFADARDVMKRLEAYGIVEPSAAGSGPRRLLVTGDELEEKLAGIAAL